MTTTANETRELADALAAGAMALAERGWLVFPLHSLRTRPDDDGRLVCTCGDGDCKAPGKHPAHRFKAAIERATSDADTVRNWWKDRTKPRNVGVRTGRASGVLVIDVDAGGGAGLAELERRVGALPETLEATTPTGGRHLYYRYPDGVVVRSSAEQLAPRVNVIGENDYVVAPPSLHRAGGTYAWVQRPVAELPAGVLALMSPAPAGSPERTASDLLSSSEPVHAADPVVQVEWGGNPYAAATGHVSGDDVRPALEALATVLAREELDPDAVIEAVVRANAIHCHPPLARTEAEKVAHVALAMDHERRVVLNRNPRQKKLDASTAEGQADAARERREERAAASKAPHIAALRAWISTWFGVVDFDENRAELRLTWTETGAIITVPVFATPAEVERVLLRYTGSLESFASRAHEKANAKQFLRILKDLARVAPARKREDDDSAPIQLVRAILAMKVWVQMRDERGETKRYPQMLSNREGFYADEGVGIVKERGTNRQMLLVHVPSLANGAFRSNAEFRGSTSRELVELLRQAPGYLGVRRPRELRKIIDTDFQAIDLEQFASVVQKFGHAEPMEISFPHSPSDENSSVSSGETANSVGELPFPQSSPVPPHVGDGPSGVGEWGKGGGTTFPPADDPFSSEIDDVFYPRGNGGTSSALSSSSK